MEPTALARRLLDVDRGRDPYLEDPSSLWRLPWIAGSRGNLGAWNVAFHEVRDPHVTRTRMVEMVHARAASTPDYRQMVPSRSMATGTAVGQPTCPLRKSEVWETDAVFKAAQVGLLRDIEQSTGRKLPEADDAGLAFVRAIDQAIASSHVLGLRYPPALLAASLRKALRGAVPGLHEAPDADATALERFEDRLGELPVLRSGVVQGLCAAVENGVPVTIVTEGGEARCRAILDALGLADTVSNLVSVRKTPDVYRALRAETAAERLLMVGDQVDRDIAFAAEAGFTTFLFRGAFQPVWNQDARRSADYEIGSFDEIIPHLAAQRVAA